MRLQPVAANSLRRLAVRDVALSNGIVIPAGVIVELAQYSVFRNPAWGWEDPNAFKPVSPRTLRLTCMHAVSRSQHWPRCTWPEQVTSKASVKGQMQAGGTGGVWLSMRVERENGQS